MSENAGFLMVKHRERYFGPFIDSEVGFFTKSLAPGSFEVLSLTVPAGRYEHRGLGQVELRTKLSQQERVDRVKIDSETALAGVLQSFMFARKAERVLTVDELLQVWDLLFDVLQCLRSLMHYAESTIEQPSLENLTALRKALWRNRGCDDVDPHYADRFW